jgi:hypothetical protein
MLRFTFFFFGPELGIAVLVVVVVLGLFYCLELRCSINRAVVGALLMIIMLVVWLIPKFRLVPTWPMIPYRLEKES